MKAPHHADLIERLGEAARVVEGAGLPEDLRPVAFAFILNASRAGSQSTLTRQARGGPPVEDVAMPQLGAGGESCIKGIADRFDLPSEAIQQIYDYEDGVVRLAIKRAMLPQSKSKAASMRDVALLVTTGRQAAGLEEFTPYEVIRTECRELKVYDSPNFASELAKLEFRTRGGRNSKEVKANRHHYHEAAELALKMTHA